MNQILTGKAKMGTDGTAAAGPGATAATKPSLLLIVHHADGDREYAYDRESSVGKLDEALDG